MAAVPCRRVLGIRGRRSARMCAPSVRSCATQTHGLVPDAILVVYGRGGPQRPRGCGAIRSVPRFLCTPFLGTEGIWWGEGEVVRKGGLKGGLWAEVGISSCILSMHPVPPPLPAMGKGKGKLLGRSPNSSVSVIPTCPSQHPIRLAGSPTP